MKTNFIIALLVLLVSVAQAALPPQCTRTFSASSHSFPYTLPLNRDEVITFPINDNADASIFEFLTLFTAIDTDSSNSLKIRINVNGGGNQRVIRNTGGSFADKFSNTQFFDGASNSIADVNNVNADGAISPIDPIGSFAALGQVDSGDVVNILIRSSASGNVINDMSIILNLRGCSGTTIVPTTTPVPTTVSTCTREFPAAIHTSSISESDRDVFFTVTITDNLETGDFVDWGVFADIISADSSDVVLRLQDESGTIDPVIRGNDNEVADLWAGVTFVDSASVRVQDVSSFTPVVRPFRPFTGFDAPAVGEQYTFLLKNSDENNAITVNGLSIVVFLEDCGTTLSPATPEPTTLAPTTAEPTTIQTCTRESEAVGFSSPVTVSNSDGDLELKFLVNSNFESGDFVEWELYLDIESAESNNVNVRVQFGDVDSTRVPVLRGAGTSAADLWAGITLTDSASIRVQDVTSPVAEARPQTPFSGFPGPSTGDVYTVLIRTSSNTPITVNEVVVRAVLTNCGTTVIPTTIAPTTTPIPTTTPEPTTVAAECVRTYTMENNLPWVANTANGAVARPRFTTEQTGGTIIWANVYAEVDCEQPGQMTMALSIEGDSTRRLMTQNIGGNQANLFGATRWFNGAARSVSSVQPTGETAPIAELIPLEFDFSAQDVDLTIFKEIRLVISYDGTGDVVVNAFSATFGFVGCEPTVTPAPTTVEPTTTEPSISP